MKQGERAYPYFAFISYKREDKKWARWLQRKLQGYRLPTRICKQNRELPKRLSPVFLDVENLTSGRLGDSLRSETQASKFLIVICSRNAHDHSTYIDQEIRFFLENHQATHVIPFIVDASPKPEQDCFPPELQKICAREELLGVNIHDSGVRRAFLKVVAYMHGLRLNELESCDDRRRRNNRALTAAAVACLMAVTAIVGVHHWNYYVPRTHYFLDYTTRFGVPEGIGELSGEDISSLMTHYAIKSVRGHVVELRHENSAGTPVEYVDSIAGDQDRPVRAVYEYYPEGGLERVTNYNAIGDVSLVMEYSKNAKIIDLTSGDEYDTASALSAHSSTAGFNSLVVDYQKSSIIRYVQEYSDEGFLLERRYAGSTSNSAAGDADGVFGLRFERDELGRAVCIRYLGYTGSGNATQKSAYEPLCTRSGVSGMRYEYENYDVVRIAHFGPQDQLVPGGDNWAVMESGYENHNSRFSRYLDVHGNPVNTPEGAALVRAEYDQRGNRISLAGYGLNDEPVISSMGFFRQKIEYDDRGYVKRAYHFGVNGEPVICSDYFSIVEYDFDERGNQVLTAFYGTDGEPVLSNEGCARWTAEYDERGNRTRVDYFGTDGQPVISSCDYAGCTYRYDERDNLIGFNCYGVNGEPVINNEKCAAWTARYDERGNRIRVDYFGVNGEPVLAKEHAARIIWKYDSRGNCTDTIFCGLDGAWTISSRGYACEQVEYDDQGSLVRAAYLDERGNLMRTSAGYAYWTAEYDERGRRIREDYFGVNGERVPGSRGYASLEQEYDERGNCIRKRYLGVDGRLVPDNVDGVAMCSMEYDDRGNQTALYCFAPNGEPVLARNGAAGERAWYDDQGNCTRVEYIGKDGKIKAAFSGVAGWTMQYDQYGNRLSQAYYGADGSPVMIEQGYSLYRMEYDGRGRIIREAYFDSEGEPVIMQSGFASVTMEHDERGNIVRTAYFDPHGEPMIVDGCAGWTAGYDAWGNEVICSYFGIDGRPILQDEGYAAVATEYDDRGRQVRIRYLGVNGEAVDTVYACAEWTSEYDDYGNEIRRAFFGVNGEPVISSENCASWIAAYDAMGNLLNKDYYDDGGAPMARQDQKSCIVCCPMQENIEDKTLQDFDVIIRFVDWSYTDAGGGADAVYSFGAHFNQLWGSKVDYEVLRYDGERQQWIPERRSGVMGELGIRIIDMKISPQAYQEIMEACGA